MLKNAEVYDVTITLNDGKKLHCLLLSKPDSMALAAIAEAKSAGTELTEAMSFANNISVSEAVGKDCISEIRVAGTLIGKVCVVTLPAYIVTPKRGRKPKSATTETTSETAETAETAKTAETATAAPTAPPTPPTPPASGGKRSRKGRSN